jgi:hypothetical protein
MQGGTKESMQKGVRSVENNERPVGAVGYIANIVELLAYQRDTVAATHQHSAP